MCAKRVVVAHRSRDLLFEDGNSLQFRDVKVDLFLYLRLEFSLLLDVLIHFVQL